MTARGGDKPYRVVVTVGRLAEARATFRLRVALVAEGEVTATTLAERLPVSRQAVVKHLAILDAAGLVSGNRVGREVRYVVRPAALDATGAVDVQARGRLGLADKAAVVTGGSKGIGLAVARTLLDEGMRVVTGSRSITAELRKTAAFPVAVDLSTPDGPQRLTDAAVAELGGIDVLINNVGVGDHDRFAEGALNDLLTLPESVWAHSLNLHFYSALRASWAARPSLIERKGVIGQVAQANGVAHDAFSTQLLGSLGVSTERLTSPEEVARLVAFAASPNNITGADDLIDGGLVKTS